jgi:Spy/CpxP family protein refolding chaperone
MAIKTKAIFALLAMAACSPLAFAQDPPQGQSQTPPPQQGQGQGQGQAQGPQGQRRMGPPPGSGSMGRQLTLDGGRFNGPMRGRAFHRRRAWRRHHRRNGFRGGPGAQGFRGGMGMRGGPGGSMGMRPGAGPDEMGPGMRAGGGRGMGSGFGPGMQSGMGRGMGPGGEMGFARFVNNPMMREQLGITDEQVTKFHQQQEDFQKAGIQNRATMQIKRMELNDLLTADKPDRTAIDRKLAEVNAAQGASEKANIDHLLAMRSLLTADQQAKLKEMMQNRMGPGGRGPMGPGGPGGRGGRGPNQPPPPKQPGGESGSTDNSRTTT